MTSKTYKHTAPKGHENCFILIPIATNLNDSDQVREKYFDMVLDRMEKLTKQKIEKVLLILKDHTVLKILRKITIPLVVMLTV